MTRNTKHAVLGDLEQTQPPCVDGTAGAGLGVLAPDSTTSKPEKKGRLHRNSKGREQLLRYTITCPCVG